MKQTFWSGKRITSIAHIAFFLFGAIYILTPILDVEWFVYFKVAPLVIAIALIFQERKEHGVWIVIFGLIFGMIGDLFLQHGGDDLFPVGAGSFLINHILYNIYFLSLWKYRQGDLLFKRKYIAYIISAILISISTINSVTTFTDKIKEQEIMLVLLIPVYSIFLNFTAILPILLLLGQRKMNFQALSFVVGGLCFYISDNVLGRSRFTELQILGSRNINSIIIMVTYYLAQYLIPLGSRQKSTSPSSTEEETHLIQSQIE